MVVRAEPALVPVLARDAQARAPAIRFEATYRPKATKTRENKTR
jgi:hypothetical protein